MKKYIFLQILIFTFLLAVSPVYAQSGDVGKIQTFIQSIIQVLVTLSGLVAAGFIVCLIAASIFGHYAGFGLSHSLILGGLLGLVAQLSDLVESLIKRDAGVKDSSTILPGHGGFLDRMDSFILTAPVMYYYLVWVILK